MAKNKRRTGKARPISSHQLFPAVVALWFGALFGLGSLAIRPALIEQAVIASRIDLVIPAAAPPLGVTARILIALVLSALGAVIGTLIARRIARPKQEVRQRKRGAANLDMEPDTPRHNGSVVEPPVRQPISALDELGCDGLDDPEGAEAHVALAGRRRALAIDHEEGTFVPYDNAPLPGGHLQILHVGGDEFGVAAAESQAEPLDLDGFAEPQATLADAVRLDWSPANRTPPGGETPVAPSVAEDGPTPIRKLFQAPPAAPGNAAEAADPITDANPSHQIFGMPVVDGAVPRDAVKAAGYQVSVFDTPEPEPLFDRPAPPLANPATAEVPASAEPTGEQVPHPADLGIADLAVRLTESMRRRREARDAAAAAARRAAADLLREPDVVPPPPPLAEREVLAVPQAQSESSASAPPPRFDPFANLPPIVLPEEPGEPAMPPIAQAPLAMPAAFRPLQFDDPGDDDPLDSLLPPRRMPIVPAESEPESESDPHLGREPAATAPAPFAAPAARARLSLSDFADSDADGDQDDNYGSLLELGRPTSSSPFVRIEEPDGDGLAAEPVVIFPGQASRPAPIPAQFAPIAPFAAPIATGAAATAPGEPVETAPFRRFDAPAQAGQGQPVASAPTPGPALDPAETERALRSALASLQRMSGAA
ncbi:MAG TPA: hypothetical protein PKJ55_00670 [Novosphingobium sp.]|nr:hypothetical protein [Novosphingobium sp.]HPZ46485.1 hypothetical protein [Novosphingobium sp.]HQD99310.1 hypothetical protein [Novosphingobium sp.]